MRLRALAPAKVNLGLFLGPTRADRRHELVTVFESLSLCDELVLETSGRDEVRCRGVRGENLAARALAALRERGWGGPPVRITIEKRIPVAAGMGGGSADAAAVLRLATALAPGRAEELEAIAAGLGADVPAQLTPGVSLATGAGERVERFDGALPEHAFVVMPSSERLRTPDVYREADRLGLPRPMTELHARHDELAGVLAARLRPSRELLVNDLQAAAVSLCPSIVEVLAAVKDAGAAEAILSGSGPTVVGVWWGEGALRRAEMALPGLREHSQTATVAVPVELGSALPTVLEDGPDGRTRHNLSP